MVSKSDFCAKKEKERKFWEMIQIKEGDGEREREGKRDRFRWVFATIIGYFLQ